MIPSKRKINRLNKRQRKIHRVAEFKIIALYFTVKLKPEINQKAFEAFTDAYLDHFWETGISTHAFHMNDQGEIENYLVKETRNSKGKWIEESYTSVEMDLLFTWLKNRDEVVSIVNTWEEDFCYCWIKWAVEDKIALGFPLH